MRTRIFVVLAVVALSLWAIYPPRQTIKLGLDLNGGVQVVLRVDTDDGLRQRTAAAAESLRQALDGSGVAFEAIQSINPITLRAAGVRDSSEFLRVAGEAAAGFVPDAEGNGTYTLRLDEPIVSAIRDETVEQAQQTIERRVNELGVAEPVVVRYGREDQILVQLPGETDVDRAKAVIKSTAQLRLTLVEQGPFADRAAALAAYGGALPEGLEVLPRSADGAPAAYYVVHAAAALTGLELRDARQPAG